MTATKTKRPTWTKATVTILVAEISYSPAGRQRRAKRTREVEAEVWGVWAVHEMVDAWAYGWEATHVPTGLGSRLSARSKAAAKTYCREVDALWDWSTINGHDGIRKMPTEVVQQLFDAARRARP